MNTVIFDRVANGGQNCLPLLSQIIQSEIARSKMSIRHWFHKKCLTNNRRGCPFWDTPLQPAQICAGSLVRQNCPANPGSATKVRFISLLYHILTHRKSAQRFVFFMLCANEKCRDALGLPKTGDTPADMHRLEPARKNCAVIFGSRIFGHQMKRGSKTERP